MAKYQFTALNINNNKEIGIVDARDEDHFRRIMRGRELVPTKYKVLDEKLGSYKLKPPEVAEFCRQLASMLSSGITAVRAMEILKERDFKPRLKSVYEKMHKDVQQGQSLSEAMLQQGKAFPVLLINMFASGEASGQLENVTNKMAIHYEKEHRLNGKVQNAMRYPKILAVAVLVVVAIIFIFVMPNFFGMLKELDVELPLITRIIIAMSDWLTSYWYILLIVLLCLIVVTQYVLSLPKVRLAFDKLKLRLPVIGKLLKIIYTARFARTLSSLYGSGVSMLRAIEITATIISNKYIESQFPQLVTDVRNGEALSASVRKIDGLDNKLPNTILIGEESGRLDAMLVSTADAYDYEAEQATGALVELVQPVMIVVMALIIMLVLLSVMLPMAELYQSFGV
ncbi:MAG: type II secretion system F family protein [Oscillospiraceae bacterium]|nr:type II secretion system F family protein [Oscillospiraceae bacterium]